MGLEGLRKVIDPIFPNREKPCGMSFNLKRTDNLHWMYPLEAASVRLWRLVDSKSH